MKAKKKTKAVSLPKPKQTWKKKKPSGAAKPTWRRICVFCSFPVEAKEQKSGGLFILCRFCGARFHLNSKPAEIGYALLESRIVAYQAAGNPWLSLETARFLNLLAADWSEESGYAKPRRTLPARKESICPFCGQMGRLSVGKEGRGLPSFGCSRCSIRIFFRGLRGFAGFFSQQTQTVYEGEAHIYALANYFGDEIAGTSRPLTLEGAERAKEAKKEKDLKEIKAMEEHAKFLREMNRNFKEGS